MSIRLSRTLSERPVEERGVLHFINRELIPMVREIMRALMSGPTTFLWSGGAATIDVSSGGYFAVGSALTSDSILTFVDGYDGVSGTVLVQQDAVGGHLLGVAASGRVVLREAPSANSNPDPTPGSVTRYHYSFVTVNTTPYLVFERLFLS